MADDQKDGERLELDEEKAVASEPVGNSSKGNEGSDIEAAVLAARGSTRRADDTIEMPMRFGGVLRPSTNPKNYGEREERPSQDPDKKRNSFTLSKNLSSDYRSRTLREKFKPKSFAEEWQEAIGDEEQEQVMDLSSDMMVEEEKKTSRPPVRITPITKAGTVPPQNPVEEQESPVENGESGTEANTTLVDELGPPEEEVGSEVRESPFAVRSTPPTDASQAQTASVPPPIEVSPIGGMHTDDSIPVLDADQVEDYVEEDDESEADTATDDILDLVDAEEHVEELSEEDVDTIEEEEEPIPIDAAQMEEMAADNDDDDEEEELDISEAEEVSPLPPSSAGSPGMPAGSFPPPAPGEGGAPRIRRRSRKSKEWWARIFNDDYVSTIPKATVRGDQRKVNFIEKNLQVPQNSLVLDLACGNGRHSVGMAKRGYRVVGIDLSLPMLAQAAELAQEENQNINFIHGDMRDLSFDRTFDAVFCMGTSFGYFDDVTNYKCLQGVARALKPGGSFLLEVANRDNVMLKVPDLTWFEGNGSVCMEESAFDFETSRLTVMRQLIMDGGRQVVNDISIRMYSLHELREMLIRAGFSVTSVSGHQATQDAFFGQDSIRILIVAKREK